MLVRSSFRDTISKVKKQFHQEEKIHLIKYDSIDNLYHEKRSSSHTDLSNGRHFLTRQHTG